MTKHGRRDSAARRRARDKRVHAIREAARVRCELGQGAIHDRDGSEHVVVWRGRRSRGLTLKLAIEAARDDEFGTDTRDLRRAKSP